MADETLLRMAAHLKSRMLADTKGKKLSLMGFEQHLLNQHRAKPSEVTIPATTFSSWNDARVAFKAKIDRANCSSYDELKACYESCSANLCGIDPTFEIEGCFLLQLGSKAGEDYWSQRACAAMPSHVGHNFTTAEARHNLTKTISTYF